MLKRSIATSVLALAIFTSAANAADKYPSRTVRMVVPYPPAGVTDVVGRIVADQLSKRLGQAFIVENRPGAGGLTGSDNVAKSEPDGYSILVGSVANTSLPAVYTHVPYDIKRDLVPLCRVITIPNFMVTGPGSGFKSVQDVINAAKANPGKLTFASSGAGASPHLTGELFNLMAGIKMVHVPYKGSGPAQIDLIANRVAVMFDNASLPMIKSGQLKGLAVSTPKRSPAAPEIPTVAESGVPDFSVTSWYGFFVPTGTPQPIIDLLNKNIVEIFKDDEIKKKMLAQGADTDVICGKDFDALVDTELTKWAKLANDIHFKIKN